MKNTRLTVRNLSTQAKEYKEEKEEERELMGKIKAKMDIIRANQRKTIDSVDYKPKHHFQGNLLSLARRRLERIHSILLTGLTF